MVHILFSTNIDNTAKIWTYYLYFSVLFFNYLFLVLDRQLSNLNMLITFPKLSKEMLAKCLTRRMRKTRRRSCVMISSWIKLLTAMSGIYLAESCRGSPLPWLLCKMLRYICSMSRPATLMWGKGLKLLKSFGLCSDQTGGSLSL